MNKLENRVDNSIINSLKLIDIISKNPTEVKRNEKNKEIFRKIAKKLDSLEGLGKDLASNLSLLLNSFYDKDSAAFQRSYRKVLEELREYDLEEDYLLKLQLIQEAVNKIRKEEEEKQRAASFYFLYHGNDKK